MTKKIRTRRKDKDASLAKLTDPQFLTLVGTPANRTGFRVLRGDEDEKKSTMEKVTAQVRKRKRSDANLVSISLPAGIDRSTADEVVELFGLGGDYELVEVDGSFVLRRTSADGKTTFPIDMGDGFVANVDAAALNRSDSKPAAEQEGKGPGGGLALVRMSFSGESFPGANEIIDWHATHDMVCDAASVVEDEEGNFSVKRYDTDQETREVSLGAGVTGHVIRAEAMDLPAPLEGAVVSEAYGNWGWGQLDFSAAMADPKFTEQSWDALYVLRDVLENIVFYSSLPVDERKSLVKGACDQYVAYMGQLIDALPKVVVERVNNSDRKSKLENVMKVEDKKAEEQAPEQLTRSDVVEIVTEAVAAALAAKPAEEPVARSDEPEAPSGEPVADAKAEDPKAERSDGADKILEMLSGITKRMDDLDTDLKGLKAEEDTAVVRSDNVDDQAEGTKPEAKRNDSVFAGLFSSLGV